MPAVLMILLIVFVPSLMIRLAAAVPFLGKLGSVFLCYAAGILLHCILAWLCRIDYHTTMITSTAGVFAPAFIIPVAKALKNDAIILPGILCGILGYAVGNYLGLGFGGFLQLFM